MIERKEIEQIICRLEKLEEEKVDIAQSVRDTFAEAKIRGYDIKVLRKLIKLRKIDEKDRIQQEDELETYKAALGMK